MALKDLSVRPGKNFTVKMAAVSGGYGGFGRGKDVISVLSPRQFCGRLESVKLPLNFCVALAIALAFASGCSKKKESPGLLPTTVMGTVRGMSFARVITHFHSPYSFDACDSKGLDADLNPNQECLGDIKRALCTNHINFTFLTDHVEHLADTDYNKLLFLQPGDTAVQKGGVSIANSIGCSDGFGAVMAPGLEGKLLALGMESHITGTIDDRKAIYGGDHTLERTRLETDTNALIAIPHTESRDLADLQTLQPEVIEIYNLHANLDPKIRKAYLGMIPFEHIAKFLNYLLDPFNELNADYLFMEYLQQAQVYFTKWNALLAAGLHVTGVGGLDSHENIFPQKASDGDRIDSHRRMTRFMNNLVLTSTLDLDGIKAALRAGRNFLTIEGLGTPMGLDFYGNQNGTIIEMGSTMAAASTSSIVFNVPTIHPDFPGMDKDEKAEISAVLYFIDGSGQESVVASTKGSQLVYSNPAVGNYRAEALMIPHHLKDFVFDKKYADRTFRWVISNPIKVQ